MTEYTRDSLIKAGKQAAAQCDGPLSRSEYVRITGITSYYIYRLFPKGGWTELRKLIGSPRHPQDKQPVHNDTLLAEFHSAATELGDIPSISQFASLRKHSGATLRRRLGNKQEILSQYIRWLQKNHPESRFLELIATKSRQKTPILLTPVQQIEKSPKPKLTRLEGTEYGAPISFRGMRHAPINEQGVVYLFGMVSYELGFIVESIQTGFPDCEAKRCVDKRRNRWQRVRIEFEFKSSNFDHDPRGCDLIVCWEHDWQECPLEVLELRSLIDKLEKC